MITQRDHSYCWPARQEQASAGSWVMHTHLVIPLSLPSWYTGTSRGLQELYISNDNYKAHLEASGSVKKFPYKGFSFSFIDMFAAITILKKNNLKNHSCRTNLPCSSFSFFPFFFLYAQIKVLRTGLYLTKGSALLIYWFV